MENIVIVGYGTSGKTAALFAAKSKGKPKITVIEKRDRIFNHPCSLPYVLDGSASTEVLKKSDHIPRKFELVKGDARKIKTSSMEVVVKTKEGYVSVNYDKLIIATGSLPMIPPVPGVGHKGVFKFKDASDLEMILSWMKSYSRVAVVGASATGLEVALAMRGAVKSVYLIEMFDMPLHGRLDRDMAEILVEKISDKVHLKLGSPLKQITGIGGKVSEITVGRETIPVDMVILTTGVKPNISLAESAGLRIGDLGGIIVDREMRTSNKQIYACGDCVETFDIVSGKRTLSMLATSAMRQGMVAGINAAGGSIEYRGSASPYVIKAGEVEIGAVGLTEENAVKAGFKVFSCKYTCRSKPWYMKDSGKITLKLVFSADEGVILGGQALGRDVYPRISVISLAVNRRLKFSDLENLEIPYNPAFSDYLDPINVVSNLARSKLAG